LINDGKIAQVIVAAEPNNGTGLPGVAVNVRQSLIS
jgi:hypothetical protein